MFKRTVEVLELALKMQKCKNDAFANFSEIYPRLLNRKLSPKKQKLVRKPKLLFYLETSVLNSKLSLGEVKFFNGDKNYSRKEYKVYVKYTCYDVS
jgi:hypothetical protein